MTCCDHQERVGSRAGAGAAIIEPGAQSYQTQILCAEGHEDTRELLIIWLGQAGYGVTITATVAECVELARGRGFDLYLISDRLIDGSGFILAETIRSFDVRTPLIFHSAQAYPKDIERGMRAGAQAYVTKPSDPAGLLQTVGLFVTADAGRAVHAR